MSTKFEDIDLTKVEKINLLVITPDNEIYNDYVDLITFETIEGYEIGILPGHSSYISPINISTVISQNGDTEEYFYVENGLAEVFDNGRVMEFLVGQAAHSTVSIEDAKNKLEEKKISRQKTQIKKEEEMIMAETDLKKNLRNLDLSKIKRG